MAAQVDAAAIARLSLHDPRNFSLQYHQTQHRLSLIEQWAIDAGSKVLELGCGQGDCTTALAAVTGDDGTVVAVDPAEPTYGAPYTLGQAQSHISKGALGKRITWVQQSPLDYLASLRPSSAPAFDATVLAHCLWYFSSPTLILETFRALKQHSKRLLLAEWSLVASQPSAQTHVLASLAQASLECRKTQSHSNIRSLLAPKRLGELAVKAGWQLEREALVQPEEGLLDGQWEVSASLSESFSDEVQDMVADERERAVVFALQDACEASLQTVPEGKKGVRAMDVWVASFK